MKIQLSLLKNNNLLKKFPNDPDHDFTIKCNDSKFQLQIAFLELESHYFDQKYREGLEQVKLNDLDERSLEGVLEVLYGGELIVKNFSNLTKVYDVISFLQIQSLKQMIVLQLQDQLRLVNPLELLEFSYKYGILTAQVSQLILHNDLQLLRDPKSSIDLSKISAGVINTVLLEYYSKSQNTQDPQTVKLYISNIMSDYFHTKKIKAQTYLQENKSDILRQIWEWSHPVFVAQPAYQSQGIQDKGDIQVRELIDSIKELEESTKMNDNQIGQLMAEIQLLKNKEEESNIIRFQDQQETRVSCLNSPMKLGVGKLEIPPKIPNRSSCEFVDDDSSQINRRINQTPGIKLIQTVKDRNRNNSNAKNCNSNAKG